MQSLKTFLEIEYGAGKVIYPNKNEYFKALDLVPLEKLKSLFSVKIRITAMVRRMDYVFR